MTVAEAAKKWDCSIKTVYNYCNDRLIPCKKINYQWVIADNQCRPLVLRTLKKEFTQSEIEFYILKAINENKYISYKTFNNSVNEERFLKIVEFMILNNYIVKIVDIALIIPNDYLITDFGKEIINKKRSQAIKFLAELLGTTLGTVISLM